MSNNRALILGGAAVAGGAVYLITSGNLFKTTAVKNVGDRWSAGGGTTTHTPAQATTRGRADQIEPPTGSKGVDSNYFKESFADQRPGEPGLLKKQFQSAHYEQEKGK